MRRPTRQLSRVQTPGVTSGGAHTSQDPTPQAPRAGGPAPCPPTGAHPRPNATLPASLPGDPTAAQQSSPQAATRGPTVGRTHSRQAGRDTPRRTTPRICRGPAEGHPRTVTAVCLGSPPLPAHMAQPPQSTGTAAQRNFPASWGCGRRTPQSPPGPNGRQRPSHAEYPTITENPAGVSE